MTATFTWLEDNGAVSGVGGTTVATTVSNVNWKNIDDTSTAYSSSPITAGNNSFQKNQYGKFTGGTFNQISAGLFAHTLTALGTGLTLKGVKVATSAYVYVTPSTVADTNLTTDMTSAIAIASGTLVYFGITSPGTTAGKAANTVTPGSDNFTTWLTTQLQTTVSAAPGDTANITLTLQYNEN